MRPGGWMVVALACVAGCGRIGLGDVDASPDAAVSVQDGASDADATQDADTTDAEATQHTSDGGAAQDTDTIEADMAEDAIPDAWDSSDNGDDASHDAIDELLSCGQLGDPCGLGTQCGGCFGPWACSGNGVCIDVGPQ